jgi:GH15 family glucan-1,4-alpha-glucosidase
LPDGERDLLWLQGHDESRPARAGNGAIHQLQLDLAGSVLWLVYHLWRMSRDVKWIEHYWWAIEALAEWARHTWSQEDASLWEYRSIRAAHTHSRLMNWVGLKAAAELALAVGRPHLAQRWQKAQVRVQDTMERDAEQAGQFLPRPGFYQADAALLALPLYGFIEARHPWFQKTLAHIETTLVFQDLVYRYREDDLGTARYPFLLAGFWYARVLMRAGRFDDADRVIARHAAQATPLGLYGEHVDLETGRARGNFPQLFSHAGLVMTLIERERLLAHQPLLTWPSAVIAP